MKLLLFIISLSMANTVCDAAVETIPRAANTATFTVEKMPVTTNVQTSKQPISLENKFLHIAVASNFYPAMKQLKQVFEVQQKITLQLTSGATGLFYAQIRNGAPYDILLAADTKTPTRLAQEQLTVPQTRFSYAVGQLVLLSSLPLPSFEDVDDIADDWLKVLQLPYPIVIPSARIAPYGAAAQAVFAYLNVKPKSVVGMNVAQTLSFFRLGNVPRALVGAAQIRQLQEHNMQFYYVPVPHQFYAKVSLEQQAVLLRNSKNIPAGLCFLYFLQSHEATNIIAQWGYQEASSTPNNRSLPANQNNPFAECM